MDAEAAHTGERPTIAAADPIERQRLRSRLHDRMFGEPLPVRVGRFVVGRRIGAGAMGVVYAAIDPDLDRRVAIKLLVGTTKGSARLVQREGRALARLRHPNVVTVHEVGTHGSDPYIAMDLVDGLTLSRWRQSKRRWKDVLGVLVQAGAGLAAAHRAGLVHRDFKPDNVLVEDGSARVVDFGLARPARAPAEGRTPSTAASGAASDTDTVGGTPMYMAPEAFTGTSDVRSDIFSFCATAYEALCGVLPFSGATAGEVRRAIAEGRVQAPAIRVPGWLRHRLRIGLAATPDDRWATMDALLDAIRVRRRRPYRVAFGLTGFGGAAFGALAVSAATQTPERCDAVGSGVEDRWNSSRRARLATAMRSVPVPHADATWGRTRAEIDRYAQGLIDARVDACRTHERGESSDTRFDATMRCLERRLSSFDTLLDELATPDERALARAITAVRGLPTVATCPSLATEPGPEAIDAEDHRQLAVGRALFALGRYEQALAGTSALATRAAHDGKSRLASRAQALLGHLHLRLGRAADAVPAARQASEHAERAGDGHARASAQTLLVSALAQSQGHSEASHWVAMTEALLDRLGDPPALVAGLLVAEGNALRGAGDYQRSVARLRQALDVRRDFLPPDDPLLATVHLELGNVLHDAGAYAESTRHMEAALALRVALLGDNHPQVAKAHNSMGALLQSEGDLEGAARHARRAIEIATTALGRDHVLVGRSTANLGVIVAQGDEPTRSLLHLRRALQIFQDAEPPLAVDIAGTLSNIGRVLAFTGDPRGAVRALDQASAVYDEHLGAAHPDHVFVLNNLSEAHLRQGDAEGALEAAKRAVRLGRDALGDRHELVASAKVRLGVAQRELVGPGRALPTLRSAVATFVELQTRGAERALARWELARALDGAGQREAALEEIQAALRDFETDPGSPADMIEDANAWLSERR